MVKRKSKDKTQQLDILDILKKTLRQRIAMNYQPDSLFREHNEKSLFNTIERTVKYGESNSIMVIGPKGCGKSVLVNGVLRMITDNEELSQDTIIIKLNGILQTDDRITLAEIARQLRLYDSLTEAQSLSFAETLQFMINTLKMGSRSSKPIVFVLDNFDLFAQHRNQTVLYNLLDVSQSAQTPVCIIGITCRLDIIELLEKRVKSRFSHRQIHLSSKMTFQKYLELFESFLSLPADFVDKEFATSWNRSIKELCENSTLQDLLKNWYHFSTECRDLQRFITNPICQLSPDHPMITVEDFIESSRCLSLDSKMAMLHGLSVLELCLIIAMKHLSDVYEGEPFNFEMVYKEYTKFTKKNSTMQNFERSAVLKAFEHLKTLEFLSPVSGCSQRTLKEYQPMTLLLHGSQIQEALQKYSNVPTEVKQWACSYYNS